MIGALIDAALVVGAVGFAAMVAAPAKPEDTWADDTVAWLRSMRD